MTDRLRILPLLIAAAMMLVAFKFAEFAGYSGGWSAVAAGKPEVEASEAVADDAEEEAIPVEEEDDGLIGTLSMERPETVVLGERVSEAETQLLARLAERREELEKQAQDLALREKLIEAAELKIEERIAELKAVEAKLDAIIAQHEAVEEKRIAGLVSMYETMKPKQAARVLERLDLDVLIMVVERMSTRKAAAILAQMDPVAAEALTVELATARELPDYIPPLNEELLETPEG